MLERKSTFQDEVFLANMEHRGEMKGDGRRGAQWRGRPLVCLYQPNLDENTAAVKELKHGP